MKISLKRTFLMAVIACYLLFSLIVVKTVDNTQDWDRFSDDFALYAAHAANVVRGRNYSDTNFIFNAADPWYSPRAYPPGFPLLLAPVYRMWGINFRAFKMEVNVFFLAALLLLLLLLSRQHGRRIAVAATILFALCPFVWDFRRYVLPDLPYLFFSLAALLALDGITFRQKSSDVPRCVLVGALIYAGLATRVIGICLGIAAFCWILIGRRMSLRGISALTGTVLIAWCIQRVTLGPIPLYATGTETGIPSMSMETQTHLHHGIVNQVPFGICLPCIPMNMYRYASSLQNLTPMVHRVNKWLVYIFLATIGIGGVYFQAMAVRNRRDGSGPLRAMDFLRNLSASDLYVLTYLAALFSMQFSEVRYLLPVLPFAFAYALEGSVAVAQSMGIGRDTGAGVMLVLGLVVYSFSYGTGAYGITSKGIDVSSNEAQDLFSFVRAKTSQDSLIVSTKPRAMALLTGRKSSLRTGSVTTPEDDLRDLLGRRVDYVLVVTKRTAPFFHPIDPPWFDLPNWRNAFKTEYASNDFELLKLIPKRAEELAAHSQ